MGRNNVQVMVDRNGNKLLLCASCLMWPPKEGPRQAITVADGRALCEDHVYNYSPPIVNVTFTSAEMVR